MFLLTKDEWNLLRSKIASPFVAVFVMRRLYSQNRVWPCFPQCERAVKVNIQIIRIFVRLRQIMLTTKELTLRLDELEKKYDRQFKVVFEAIRQLMLPENKPKKRIGFQAEEEKNTENIEGEWNDRTQTTAGS